MIQFLIKPRGRRAHAFDIFQPGIPMVSLCRKLRAWPQKLTNAAGVDMHYARSYNADPPEYCPNCFDRFIAQKEAEDVL